MTETPPGTALRSLLFVLGNDLIEAGAAGIYGERWNDPDPSRRPTKHQVEKYRGYARKCLDGVADWLDEQERTAKGL